MKKQEFIKKLDIYMIIMRRKLIDDPDKNNELKNSIIAFRIKLLQRKKLSNDLIKTMLNFKKTHSKE